MSETGKDPSWQEVMANYEMEKCARQEAQSGALAALAVRSTDHAAVILTIEQADQIKRILDYRLCCMQEMRGTITEYCASKRYAGHDGLRLRMQTASERSANALPD